MALDLSKIKGISDEVKAKLAKVASKDELDAVLKAENLTVEQLNEMAGGDWGWKDPAPGCDLDWCVGFDYCFGEGCSTLPL